MHEPIKASCQGAYRVVYAKVGGGPVGQVAHHEAVWLAAVLVHDHDVRKIVRPARLDQLRDDLRSRYCSRMSR